METGAGADGILGVTQSSTGAGVHGTATSGDGVAGTSGGSTDSGVYGSNTNHGYGVAGRVSPAGAGTAIYGDNNSGSGWAGYFNGNLQVTGTPYCSGCTAFTNNSDIRLKKNVQPLTGALDRLLKLHAVTFEWKAPEEHGDHTGPQRGFIAQDVEKVIPEWVGVDQKGFKTLNMSGIEALTVESLRTLKLENDALRDRVKALEDKRTASAAGLNGNGLLNLTGALVLAGAFMLSRRRGQPSQA